MTELQARQSGSGKSQKTTMRAARIVAPGKVEIQQVPLPHPGPGEVRVRLEGCGVCASNLPPWEGRPWFNYPLEAGGLGHEAWGEVDELGAGVEGFRKGQRVTLLSYHAYAEYDVAPAEALVALPDSLEGVAFPGEPLGCAMNIFARAQVQEGQTVAIVGIGFLGALLTRLASKEGARVLAIARRPFAQEVARRMEADQVLPMEDHYQIIEQVKQLTGEKFCEVTIEATGKQWPLDLAAELTGERGRLIVAGYHQDGPRQVNMQLWNWRGLDVINAHERDSRVYMEGIRKAVQAVSAGTLQPASLFTHSFELEQLADALNATRERPDGFMKALVKCRSSQKEGARD